MQGIIAMSAQHEALYHNGWWASGDLAYLAEGEVFITVSA